MSRYTPPPKVTAFLDPDDAILFPRLTAAQIEQLAEHAETVSFSPGEILFEQGQRDTPFFVVLSGAIDIIDRQPDGDHYFTQCQAGTFIGDISMFTGEPTIAACIAAEPTDVIAFDRTKLRHMTAKWPEFAEHVLRTMAARRDWLVAHGIGVLRLIAPRGSNRAFQVRDLLERNLLPVQWFDVDADAESAELLQKLNIPRNETPVLVRNAEVLRNPSPAQVARELGLRADVDGQRFDLVVLGAGPAGEVAVNAMLKAEKRVALVERELIGGECTNWGCIPSKTLLHPPELRGVSARTAGTKPVELDFAALAEYRDWMVSYHDDTKAAERYRERGATVVKGDGRLDGRGRVVVGDRALETDAVLVATGADAVIPPIPGLAEAGYWTNREVTALSELPRSVVFIGGGVVSVELGQFLARFGVPVTIVQGPDRIANREEPHVSSLLEAALREDGIEVVLGRRATAVEVRGSERVVILDDGAEVAGERLVVATGRRARTEGYGLETVGIEPGPRGIAVDDRCRAADGVWAVGDVTGLAMFTHVAKYQARIACADVLGEPARADLRAVPRVLFTDPEVASVGITEAQAREEGRNVAAATIELRSSVSRAFTYERDPKGELGVVVDVDEQVLLGAWAVAPLASEWIHVAVLAIRARVPLDVLADTIAQFPTFTEGLGIALRRLPRPGTRSTATETTPVMRP
jgi:pyruvate/2-oxoglutarate dehydrogenase complex dihydrolipoamide dehydrogenase (E3) component